MPLQRRLPKRGFNNPFRKVYQIVNIGDLDRFESQTEVDRRILREAGLIRRKGDGVKLLGNGEITKPLVVKVDKVSPAAKSKIEAAGGKIEAV
jgi:large subunit ribosomal protein L15